jgi:hypothetical protein
MLKGKVVGIGELGTVQTKAVACEVQLQNATKDLRMGGFLTENQSQIS